MGLPVGGGGGRRGAGRDRRRPRRRPDRQHGAANSAWECAGLATIALFAHAARHGTERRKTVEAERLHAARHKSAFSGAGRRWRATWVEGRGE